MCTGAILLYKIPRLVIGENLNFTGEEDLLRSRGVEVIVLDDEKCKELMGRYIREKPEVSDIDMRSEYDTHTAAGLVRRHRRNCSLNPSRGCNEHRRR